MKRVKKLAAMGLMMGLAAGGAKAANVPVNANIAVSTTWTASNVYNLVGQIYVLPGATLTIEPGTLIKSNAAELGSLAITRGAKIIAAGTASSPIIFTSVEGEANVNHLGLNTWGNIAILGKALISASHSIGAGNPVTTYDETADAVVNPVSNTLTPTGLNKVNMEGFTPLFGGDPKTIFGGADDNDDSGTLTYVSLRYGGKVIGLGNELNGLSLGGVGRETDIHHIDMWNNVDDGIEVWGGTVNLKYLNVWNYGDDGMDLDQGWRGKAQFGLFVQGYAQTGVAQGSGASDNNFEIDGAERSDAVPVTTATLYNFTMIGQPDKQGGVLNAGGDHGVALRDGARVQLRNMLFIDTGERLLVEEASDTDTASWRYGLNGSMTYAQTWTTAYTEAVNPANPLTGGYTNSTNYLGSGVPMTGPQLQTMYQSQSAGNAAIGQGFLNEITDSTFNIVTVTNAGSAFTNANGSDAVGVTTAGASAPGKGNVVTNGAISGTCIATLTRDTPVTVLGALTMGRVATLDPRRVPGVNTDSTSAAPADGFFTPAKYKGAFSDKTNWAKGWTAADAYGKFVGPANPSDPASALILTATSSFLTVTGVTYTVESSKDGVNWTPIATIVGDGTIFKITDLSTFDNAKLYRVIAQ